MELLVTRLADPGGLHEATSVRPPSVHNWTGLEARHDGAICRECSAPGELPAQPLLASSQGELAGQDTDCIYIKQVRIVAN